MLLAGIPSGSPQAGNRVTDDRQPEDVRICPNCGDVVVYRGVGRRPVWCSTRCRNDAALRRLGARMGAVEVRVVEVPSHRAGRLPESSGVPVPPSGQQEPDVAERRRKAAASSPQQALRIIRDDPEAVGKLLSYLERRRLDGTLITPEWLPVRNGFRIIAGALPPGIERPT